MEDFVLYFLTLPSNFSIKIAILRKGNKLKEKNENE
jgi:hypothetical protein